MTSLSAAEAGSNPGAFSAKGYLNLRYAYIGSASKETVYHGLRLTGSFELAALSNKVVLKYRSHHWIQFERTSSAVLESPFENRNIFQTVYLEARDIGLKGLRFRVGRMFPEMDYANLMIIDGGWLSWDAGNLNLTASAGRALDAWNGKPDGLKLQAAFGARYRTDRWRAFLGFNTGEYFGYNKKELPAGLNVLIGQDFWLDAYGSYDFEAKELSRAGFSVSWRKNDHSLSLMASQWRNPFDQLFLADKSRSSVYWGDYSTVPRTYTDVRLSFAMMGRGLGFRGSAGLMGGVRSGWLASASMMLPSLYGFRLSVGGQAMKTDFIEFYSLDVLVQKSLGAVSLQVLSQARSYQWRPRPSGFHNADNYTELSIEYPLLRHWFIGLSGGGYFRNLGNESFKPQAELRLIVRL